MKPTIITAQINGKPVQTTVFQLMQWKHALRLEEKGMTLSRGQKVSTYLRKLCKIKRSVPIKEITAMVEIALEEAHPALQEFLFTFGRNHAHRLNNITLDEDIILSITAKDYGEAREIMFENFGLKWASQYEKGELKEDLFPRGIVKIPGIGR